MIFRVMRLIVQKGTYTILIGHRHNILFGNTVQKRCHAFGSAEIVSGEQYCCPVAIHTENEFQEERWDSVGPFQTLCEKDVATTTNGLATMKTCGNLEALWW